MARSSDVEDYADAESSATIPCQCSSLRKNDYVILRDHPCKIVEMSTSRPGKHGHAKVHFVGLDIFNGKKYEDIFPAAKNVYTPVLKRKDYEFIHMNENGVCSLKDTNNSEVKEIKLPQSDLAARIRKIYDKEQDATIIVTVVAAMGQETITRMRHKTAK